MNNQGKAIFTQSGIQTSIQDLGRPNLSSYGVPHAGAMDQRSLSIANLILGNTYQMPCIEIGITGCKLLFEDTTEIAIYGAQASILLNKESISTGKRIHINGGDLLEIQQIINGNWLYIAIKNGINSEQIAESGSWLNSITEYSRFQKGMFVAFPRASPEQPFKTTFSKIKPTQSVDYIDVWRGPEWELLSSDQMEFLKTCQFSVSNLFNRMAYQLNEKVSNQLPGILSSPTFPGTVQLTPSGTLIVLMRDSQVTGGYPRVLQLAEESIDVLAQMPRDQKFRWNIL
jgi:allophanate hydrolase subunit 2